MRVLKTGKPVGLKEFGDWQTIYEGLSQLPCMYKKAGLVLIIFILTMHFPLFYPRYIEMARKSPGYWR
jgi:hypothetical protein